MSDDNSVLPVLESVPFKKQMQIFNAIFEKKNHSMRPMHYAAIFQISDFRRGAASLGISFSVLLRECRKKNFLKIRNSCPDINYFTIDCFFFSFSFTGNAGRLLELHNRV